MAFKERLAVKQLIFALACAQLVIPASYCAAAVPSPSPERPAAGSGKKQKEQPLTVPAANPGAMTSATEAGGSSFLLPFDPNIRGPEALEAPVNNVYHLGVEKVDIDSDFGEQIGQLLDAGIFKTTKFHVLEQAVARYRSKPAEKVENGKDIANSFV